MKIINIFTICLAVIFESFFGVFVSNAMKFSIENIKSAPKYMQKDLQNICDILNKKDISDRTRVRLLREMSNYSDFSDQYIDESIDKIMAELTKKQADQFDKEYDELWQDIESKEKRICEIQAELNKHKSSCNCSGEFINSIQDSIDECIESIKIIKTKMEKYDATKKEYDTKKGYNQIVADHMLNKKKIIIQDVEKNINTVWSEYSTVLMNMYYLNNAECDSDYSGGDKHDDKVLSYIISEQITGVKTGIDRALNMYINTLADIQLK